MNTLNNNAYKILASMYDKENNLGLVKSRGINKEDIVKKTGFSLSTVTRAIKLLQQHELIEEAIKQVNTKTYYVTQKGYLELKSTITR